MAKKQKYKLLCGTHSEGKKIYKPGAVVESALDLEKVHGAEKFILENKFNAGAEEAAAAAIEEQRGENVTGDFDIATEASLSVYKKKGRWAVYEEDGTVVAGRLAKKNVSKAIQAYIDEEFYEEEEGEEDEVDDEEETEEDE